MNALRTVLALLLLVVAACGAQTPVEPGAAAFHESTTKSDTTDVEINSPYLGGSY